MEEDLHALPFHLTCEDLALFAGPFIQHSFSFQHPVDLEFPVAYQDSPRCLLALISLIESEFEPAAFWNFGPHRDLPLYFTPFIPHYKKHDHHFRDQKGLRGMTLKISAGVKSIPRTDDRLFVTNAK